LLRDATAHRGAKAKRKNPTSITWPAELVATATDGQDDNLVAAAVLHDTVEDTATLPAKLAAVFNADVANLVLEVTDDKSLDKARR
jgi:GTP diphosphokinase / guanosine-3',5'-bis(diphosphate) 3'-diphosphatase